MRHSSIALGSLAVSLALAACSPDEPLGPRRSDDLASSSPAPRAAGLEINYMKFTIDHHAMGIMMAEMCIEKAVHEELRDLCARNMEQQSSELALLQDWLQEWYGITYEPRLTQGDQRMMEHMAELSGAAFEIEFMETFSRHHHQIIQRSQPVVKQAEHEPLRELAAEIIAAQSADIQAMLTWLCEWYDICHPRFGFTPASLG